MVGHAEVVAFLEEGTDEWLEKRRNGIGGSDSPVVLGFSPYGNNRKKLWDRKTGRRDQFSGNVATLYGSRLEHFIRLYLADRADDTPSRYSQFNDLEEIKATFKHPDYDWMRANTDGFCEEREKGVEIKTSSKPYDSFNEDIHPYHYPQIQHYLAVTGLESFYYVYVEIPFDREYAIKISDELKNFQESADFQFHLVDRYWNWLANDSSYVVKEVGRDDSYIENLIEIEKDFWQCVVRDVEPPEFHPDGAEVISDREFSDDLWEYMNAKEKIKEIKERDEYQEAKEKKEEKKQKIKQFARSIPGEPKRIHDEFSDGSVTWNARGYYQVNGPKKRDVGDDEFVFDDVPF